MQSHETLNITYSRYAESKSAVTQAESGELFGLRVKKTNI